MKKMSLLVLLFLVFTGFSDKIIRGKIVKVSDGDTVTLLTADNEQIKIRLDEIDAPENGQDFGEKSRVFLADLIAGKEVEVKSRGKDRYGRVLGTIYINGLNVNEALVRNGLAWHYKHFSKNARLDSLEKVARSEKINIWSHPNPIEPYQFRQNKKNKSTSDTSKPKPLATSSICGAPTKNGTPCQRKVAGGGKCWQHK